MAHNGDLRIDRASLKPDVLLVGFSHILIDQRLVFQWKEAAGKFELKRPEKENEKLVG